jgi:hypothetical protein
MSARVLWTAAFTIICGAFFISPAGAQNPPPPLIIPIDTLPIDNLPLGISEASFRKTKKGESLKLSIANSSDEQIFGVRYWLLIVDSANKVLRVVDQSENVKFEAYSAKTVSFPAPSGKVSDDDRIFLVVAQVIGRNSIWEVQQAKTALLAYAKGDPYATPNVVRMLNQVDSPIGFSPIFLLPR